MSIVRAVFPGGYSPMFMEIDSYDPRVVYAEMPEFIYRIKEPGTEPAIGNPAEIGQREFSQVKFVKGKELFRQKSAGGWVVEDHYVLPYFFEEQK